MLLDSSQGPVPFALPMTDKALAQQVSVALDPFPSGSEADPQGACR